MALLAASGAAAQEPADLVAARSALMAKVLAESRRVTEQYVSALAVMEASLAAEGDYEQARQFQQRREQLEAIYQDGEGPNAVPLSLAGTRLMGSAQASGESLGNFRSGGSGVEWSLFRLTPGKYRLEFEANMTDAPVAFATAKLQPQDKAVLDFGEVTSYAGAANNRVRMEITRSVDETAFATVQSAEMTFTRTPVTLRLVGAGGYPANIIRLRGLKLVPVVETASAGPADALDGKAALEAVRANLSRELAEVQKVVIDAYRAELERAGTEDAAAKNEVQAELKRLQRVAEKKEDKPRFSPPRSSADAGGSLDGFDEIIEAVLVEEAVEAGDRFKVRHDGKELKVRLLWIQCPPAEKDQKLLESLAARFRVDVEDALAVGRAARDFTAGYLRGKTLRLTARPMREGADELEALVFLPDVGLFQNVLLDQGLAAMAPTQEKRPGPGEAALLKALSEREKAAQERRPPSGAWALSHDNTFPK